MSFEATYSSPAYLNEAYPITLQLVNNDTIPVSLSLDALLHPVPSQIQPDGQIVISDFFLFDDDEARARAGEEDDEEGSHRQRQTSTTGHVLAENLAPGGKLDKVVYLTCLGLPGPRMLDLSILAKPLPSPSSSEKAMKVEAVTVAPTDLSKQLVVQAAHPFFCDFKTMFYRSSSSFSPSSALSVATKGRQNDDNTQDVTKGNSSAIANRKRRGIMDMSEPDIWSASLGGQKVLLDVNMGALGPTDVEVLNVTLNFEVCPGQPLSKPEGES